MSASAATLAAAATKGFSASRAQRVFVASGTPEGIRSFDWNPARGSSQLPALRPTSVPSTGYASLLIVSISSRLARSTALMASPRAKSPASASSTENSSSSQPRTPPAKAPATAPSITPAGYCLQPTTAAAAPPASESPTASSVRWSGASTTRCTAPTPTARRPPTHTSPPSRPTIASPTSTTSAATDPHLRLRHRDRCPQERRRLSLRTRRRSTHPSLPSQRPHGILHERDGFFG